MSSESNSNNNAPELPEPESKDTSNTTLGVLFYVAIALYIAWSTTSGKVFLTKWWWVVGLAILAILVIIQIKSVRKWLDGRTSRGRVALIIFIVIPVILILVGAVVILPDQYQVAAIRSIFFLVVCLFPAIMYYLFISTRKYSLLGEYLSNLDQLGLIEAPQKNICYNNYFDTFIQKFQGVYGPLPENFIKRIEHDFLINPSNDEENDVPDILTETITAEIFTPETSVPVVLATVLIALGWLIILPPWSTNLDPQFPEAFIPKQTPINFAFLGAYFFSIQMLFRRYVRRDLRASAYVSVSLRIILAIIGIWAVETLLPSDFEYLVVLGFVIGVFPQTAWHLIQGFFIKRIGGIFLPDLKTLLPLRELDGITVWNEARLEEEDIENIPNMATADIVDLMLNTRISSDRIIDWIDQAILYTHLGTEGKSKRNKLHSYGIRTATDLIEICEKKTIPEDINLSELLALKNIINTNTNLKLIKKWKRKYSQ